VPSFILGAGIGVLVGAAKGTVNLAVKGARNAMGWETTSIDMAPLLEASKDTYPSQKLRRHLEKSLKDRDPKVNYSFARKKFVTEINPLIFSADSPSA
jgi:hypothetical protein